MNTRHRKVSIVVAGVVMVSVILMAILIPNVLDVLEESKQKRCLNAMRQLGSLWFSWLTDQVDAAAAGASESRELGSEAVFLALPEYPTVEELYSVLDPSGTRPLPPADCPVEIWAGRDPLADGGMRIRMPGPNGVFEDCQWDKKPVDQLDSCGDDVLWADGFFVRYPAGTQVD